MSNKNKSDNIDEIIILQSPPPKFEDIQKEIFCKEANDFLYKLHNIFEKRIGELYNKRLQRKVELKTKDVIDFKQSPERSDKKWKISPLPTRLQYVCIY